MSEFGAEEMRGVSWPSNGFSEVPFRLYTDPEQYRLEQERIFKGPAWSFLCLDEPRSRSPAIMSPRRSARPRSSSPATMRAHQRLPQQCAHRGNLLCLERQGNVSEIKCIYHGWTYDSTGKLPGSPSSAGSSGRAACRPNSARTSTICRGSGWLSCRPGLRHVRAPTRLISKPISGRR